MTFVPDLLVGSPNLVTSNWLFLWVYLVFFNGIWVVVPAALMYQSWVAMKDSFSGSGASGTEPAKKRSFHKKKTHWAHSFYLVALYMLHTVQWETMSYSRSVIFKPRNHSNSKYRPFMRDWNKFINSDFSLGEERYKQLNDVLAKTAFK